MDSCPVEICSLIANSLDDRSRRMIRLANTLWFSAIQYNDFKFYYTTNQQGSQIVKRLEQYTFPVGISFKNSKCTLTKEHYEELGRLTHLIKLYIGEDAYKRDTPIEDLHPLTNLTNLEELDVTLPSKIMKYFTKLRVIYLKGIEHAKELDLDRFKNIESVSWAFVDEPDDPEEDPTSIVSHTNHITKLHIYTAPIDIIDKNSLATYTGLKDLVIKDYSGCEKLFVIPHLPNLESLEVSVWNLAGLAPVHENLTSLTMDYQNMDKSIFFDLTNLRKLSIGKLGENDDTIDDFALLWNMTNLESFEMRSENGDWGEITQFFNSEKLTSLQVPGKINLDTIDTKLRNQLLELTIDEVIPSDNEPLLTFTNLTRLLFTAVTKKDFSAIEKMTNLKSLHVETKVHEGTWDKFDKLNIENLTALEEFEFNYRRDDDNDDARIDYEKIGHLKLKKLRLNWPVTAGLIDNISNMTTLEQLQLYNSSTLFEISIQMLGNLINLTDLTLQRVTVYRLSDTLTLLTNLQTLNVWTDAEIDVDVEELKNKLPWLYYVFTKEKEFADEDEYGMGNEDE